MKDDIVVAPAQPENVASNPPVAAPSLPVSDQQLEMAPNVPAEQTVAVQAPAPMPVPPSTTTSAAASMAPVPPQPGQAVVAPPQPAENAMAQTPAPAPTQPPEATAAPAKKPAKAKSTTPVIAIVLAIVVVCFLIEIAILLGGHNI
jgi:hypothetical protein